MIGLAEPHFRFAFGFTTLRLAYLLDSLVRVSRRVIVPNSTHRVQELMNTPEVSLR